MQESHYRQAAHANGRKVTYKERSLNTSKKGEEVYGVQDSTEVWAKIKGEDNISQMDLDLLDIGQPPEDAKVLMLEDVGVGQNDAFEFNSTTYEVYKVADHFGESGEKVGQRVLVMPE